MGDSALGYFARKDAFNASQGYRVDYKYVGMAYAIEAVVVATSLASAWFFAKIYGHNDATTMAMMMLGPIAYAGIEIARVPLALALRTQPSWFWKIVFAIMVLCAVAVSVKSLSQLGEVMFRPRLTDVTRATAAWKDAQSAQATFAGKVRDADAAVAQRSAELNDAEARLKSVNTELGALPADKCARVWHLNSLGHRYSSQECHTDGRQKVMSVNLADAERARSEASDKLDTARKTRDALDPTAVSKRVADLELARRDAIMNSQLHSFTAMFFGKDPTEVTEAELHNFLRLFVFFPAIFAALAATALALASVTPLREEPEPVEVDDRDLVEVLLEPLTRAVGERTEQIASTAVAKAMVAHRATAKTEPVFSPLQGGAPEPPASPAPSAPASEPPGEPPAPEPAEHAEEQHGPPRPVGPMRPTLVSTNPPSGAA